MLSWYEVRTAITHPRIAAMTAHGLIRDVVSDGTGGTPVLDRDWDNLLILDACRYDMFEELNTLRGELTAVTSLGSSTGEFMRKNFSDGEFPEIVYVSANPNPAEVNAKFHDVVPLYESAWDEALHTVPPEPVVKAAIEAQERYPHKRIIVHLLQPHYPWIGPEGQKFHEQYGRGDLTENNIWMRLRDGEIPAGEIWKAYRENLEIVLPHVQTLLNELTGKTVVTSDHGNCFGERGVYGHPERVYPEPLIKVPWLEVTGDSRKSITSGSGSESFDHEDEAEMRERLRDLGYIRER